MGDWARAVEPDDGRALVKRRWESMTAPHRYKDEAPFCPGGSADTSIVVGGLCQQNME
jgi:hypothetical protein